MLTDKVGFSQHQWKGGELRRCLRCTPRGRPKGALNKPRTLLALGFNGPDELGRQPGKRGRDERIEDALRSVASQLPTATPGELQALLAQARAEIAAVAEEEARAAVAAALVDVRAVLLRGGGLAAAVAEAEEEEEAAAARAASANMAAQMAEEAAAVSRGVAAAAEAAAAAAMARANAARSMAACASDAAAAERGAAATGVEDPAATDTDETDEQTERRFKVARLCSSELPLAVPLRGQLGAEGVDGVEEASCGCGSSSSAAC